MKVYLRKSFKAGEITLDKGSEGWLWACLLHNDSFLVNFKDVRVEVSRAELDFSAIK